MKIKELLILVIIPLMILSCKEKVNVVYDKEFIKNGEYFELGEYFIDKCILIIKPNLRNGNTITLTSNDYVYCYCSEFERWNIGDTINLDKYGIAEKKTLE